MNQEAKEELRRLVRGWLADRAALGFNATAIHRGVSREMACTVPEVEDAIALLSDLKQLKQVPNRLGATKYWQIAAEGTLAHERGE